MSRICRLLLCAAVTLMPAALHAQTTRLDTIIANGVLRVGMPGDYRPFGLRDAAGKTTGIDVDMAGSLAKAMGVRLEIVPTIWGTLLADLAADKFDVGMGGISITLGRQKVAFFSAPVMRGGKSAIGRCSEQAKFQNLTAIDQKGVKVITNPGGTNEQFDRATLKNAEIVVFPDNLGVWNELVAGHADVMITDNVETQLQQKLHPELCAIHPDAPFSFDEKAYLLPRDIALKAFVDQWLHISAETGEMQRITKTYLD